MASSKWTFYCYIEARQRGRPAGEVQDIVDQWCTLHGDEFTAKLDARLKYLAEQMYFEWGRPRYAALHGDGKPLGEIRFIHENVQRRLLGAVIGKNEYVWLFGANEINNRFVPKSSIETALNRLSEVLKDRSAIRACDRN